EPQMIAQAIATYQRNNDCRHDMGLNPLHTMTIPCITMVGTRVTFYLVPVTNELNAAVVAGEYPLSQTRVRKCTVDHVGGMEYRKLAF
ncbi:hypothetical protein DEU56DRAFT_745352, partial [Suillus clintonianus]|uniref:uncharacterized protein n=1 Tax=Suillus clintonianus TaxID=1904413 RepID=UPI001B8705E2